LLRSIRRRLSKTSTQRIRSVPTDRNRALLFPGKASCPSEKPKEQALPAAKTRAKHFLPILLSKIQRRRISRGPTLLASSQQPGCKGGQESSHEWSGGSRHPFGAAPPERRARATPSGSPGGNRLHVRACAKRPAIQAALWPRLTRCRQTLLHHAQRSGHRFRDGAFTCSSGNGNLLACGRPYDRPEGSSGRCG